jgi:hypothetical protein
MTSVASATSNASTVTADTTAPILPVGADPEAALAILEVVDGAQAEQADRSDRESAELQEEHADDAAVATMHDKASLMRTQAWVDFGMATFSACVQASDAAASGSTGSGAGGEASQDAAMIKAVQSLADGNITASEQNDDADVKSDQAASTVAGFTVQSDNQAMGDAADLVKAALSAYQQYVTTQAQTQAAALHRA